MILLLLAISGFLLVTLVEIHLGVVDAPKVSGRVLSFLNDVLLFLHLALVLVLINHVPERHPVVWMHLIGPFVLTLSIIVLLGGC